MKRSPKRKASTATSRQYGWRSKMVAGVLTFMLLAGGTFAHWQAEQDNEVPAPAASTPMKSAPVAKAPAPASRVDNLPPEALAPQPPMVAAGYNAHSGMLPPGALPPGVTLPGLSHQVSGVPNAAVGMSPMGVPVGMMAQGGRTVAQGYGMYDGVRQQFTGKERDNETGLDYFGARYYSATQGRFTSVDPENAGADPANPQSWNGYAYALNNPLKYVDPDGRTVRICDKDGKCSEVSDETANRYLFNKAYQRAEGLTVKGGKIYGADGNQIGTYANLDIDGAPFSRAIPEAGRYPYGKATLAFGGLSVAGGLGLYSLGVVGSGSGLTTLGLGTTPALTGEAAVTALASQLQFTATTAARQAMASRRVPLQTLAQAILNGKRVPDPQGAAGAIKIVHEIYKNGKKYNLEIIYREADKKILHFLYK